jgi:hypothetical protein
MVTGVAQGGRMENSNRQPEATPLPLMSLMKLVGNMISRWPITRAIRVPIMFSLKLILAQVIPRDKQPLWPFSFGTSLNPPKIKIQAKIRK